MNGPVGFGRGGAASRRRRDFWKTENRKFDQPHYRLEKIAKIVRNIAHGEECDLLDVGCGPAALAGALPENIRYHGIDIAIPEPAANLLEIDILEDPIGFNGKKFDIVVAQGVFEYMGDAQEEKFADIAGILSSSGTFVTTYVNFGHHKRVIYGAHTNVQPLADFRASLTRHFTVDRSFPTAHNWNHSEPNRRFMKVTQRPLQINFPIVSRRLAVEYVFICSPLTAGRP